MNWTAWTKVSDAEYRANLIGMNTFFGAVLGFVLAEIETESLLDFAQLLIFTAAIVIGILYVSASAKRWLNAAIAGFLIAFLPLALSDAKGDIGRLQVTLAIWLLLTVVLEAWSVVQRRRAAKRTGDEP